MVMLLVQCPIIKCLLLQWLFTLKGMTTREISDLTMTMVGTGQQIDLSEISGIKWISTLLVVLVIRSL